MDTSINEKKEPRLLAIKQFIVHPTNNNYSKYELNGLKIIALDYKEACGELCGIDTLNEPRGFIVDNYDVEEYKTLGTLFDDDEHSIYEYLKKYTDLENVLNYPNSNAQEVLNALNSITVCEKDIDTRNKLHSRMIKEFEEEYKNEQKIKSKNMGYDR